MKRNLFFISLCLLLIGSCKPAEKTQTSKEPVLEVIGGKPVYTSEFNYVYKKNNANSPEAFTRANVDEYLKLYTNFKLKVREAEELGLDTAQSFKKELDGYKKQLAQPYLTEKGVTEELTKQAYERMKEEINASHILLNLSPDAEPKDTLKAYNKILTLRQKALSGENFETLARENSDDPSAKNNNGNLGYFTALQMVYPFEEAAYSTPVGQISQPVRTRFGYHILKVNARRKSQGQVRVAHIMTRATAGMGEKDSLAAIEKIKEIYSRLQKGEDWNQLASQFSDDANSKSKGGELPWFSTGKMIPSFEEASFKLTREGEYSAPILTPYGWHIIKLLSKKELEPFAELEPTIKAKVTKDSRSDLNKTKLIQRLKSENNFTENNKVLDAALIYSDSSLLAGTWNKSVDPKNNPVLFSINKENYTINDFFTYIKSKQKSKKGITPSQYMRTLYKDYSEEKLIDYEEAHLEEKYEDYKRLVQEYRDGILLFQLMDEKVWSKAIEDTAGLKKFFNSNRDKYKWSERAEAVIYDVNNKETLEKLKPELNKGKYSVNQTEVKDILFENGKADINADVKKQLDKLAQIVIKDKALTVEIEAGADAKEQGFIALNRGVTIYNYLKAKGIDSTRIVIKDLGKSLAKKSDKERALDRMVSVKLFSKSVKALETKFNSNAPLTLQITEGHFQKGENEILKKAEWKEGTQTIEQDGRVYFIIIKKIEQPRNKTFEESRGLAISDYQTFLEEEWVKELKAKYPVVVNQEEINKLVTKN